MNVVSFQGEESSRFVRFASHVLAHLVPVKTHVVGRDPMTSRLLEFEGHLLEARNEGYLRLIVVQEFGSGITYWVGGSNSTRSINTRKVSFQFDDDSFARLSESCRQVSYFVPGMCDFLGLQDDTWRRLDRAVSQGAESDLFFLLQCVGGSDVTVSREAAFALRSCANYITQRRSEQRRTEAQVLNTLSTTHDRDTKVGLVELLGYIATSTSIPTLSALATTTYEHEQVRWAAGIALGRIAGDQVLPPLIQLLKTSTGWTAAGAMLGLARHAESRNQAVLESIFLEYLSGSSDPTLKRYSSLGLSRFSSFSEPTQTALLDCLGNAYERTDVRGFAALALASSLPSITSARREDIRQALASWPTTDSWILHDPEYVWGLEFAAELATLLELNTLGSKLHGELAFYFDDWRASYYEALSKYELSDALCRDGDIESALELLHEAHGLLRPEDASSPSDREAIIFRRDLVRARTIFQEVLGAWKTAMDVDEIANLARALDEPIAIYARYARAQRPSAMGIKRLSEREVDYLQKSHQLIKVLRLVIELDQEGRSPTADQDALQSKALNIKRSLAALSEQFDRHLAEGPRRVADGAISSVERMILAFKVHVNSPVDRVAALVDAADDIRSVFAHGTWPLPARACPVGGLGRGALQILKEDVDGEGSDSDPLVFPADSPAVLNVIVHIQEMAPGVSTSAVVRCAYGGRSDAQIVSAIEGSTRLSFVLPDVLSAVASTVCTLRLMFEARDCVQSAAELVLYLRRAKS